MSGPTGPTGEGCAIVAMAGTAWLIAGAVLFAYWRAWRRDR